MVKYILNTLLILLISSSLCSAKVTATDLKNEYGPQLKSAPFFLRYKFHRQYQKDWKESSYQERERFLINWHEQLLQQQKKDQEQAKIQERLEKERLRQKVEQERKKERNLKDKEQAHMEEQKADEQRKREFGKRVEGNAKTIDIMRRGQDRHR